MDGWISCQDRLPEEDKRVLFAALCEADDHSTGATVRFAEVYSGTIYEAAGLIIATTDGGDEYENWGSVQEILGWQPLPSAPSGSEPESEKEK